MGKFKKNLRFELNANNFIDTIDKAENEYAYIVRNGNIIDAERLNSENV